jgi:general secretion pathway protein D
MTMTSLRAKRPRAAARAGTAALAAALLIASLPLPAATPTASGTPAPRFRGAPVTLNFVNADIEGVARAMAAILRQQFIVDPRVRGSITLYSEEPLTPNEANLNFLAALRGLGFTVVEVNGIFKVVPEADAKLQAGTVSIDSVSRRGDQVITQIFRLNHENANNLVPVLRPLITPNNTINANPGNNTLVITDYADNLQRLGQIIAAMDTPAAGDVEVIPLRYAVASDIAPLLQRLTDSNTPGAVPGQGAGSTAAPSILIDTRSNSLIVRSANPSKMAGVKSLIAKLDVQPQGSAASGNIWVVHLKNADATKLAQVLRAAFSAGSGGASSGGGGTTMPTGANAPGAAGTNNPVSAAAAPLNPSAGPSTGGFIQADPSTNSLIITAPEPLYRQVRGMIDQLDERRAQVYIESMIVEVTGSNTADFGFQWQGLLGGKNSSNYIVGGTNFSTTGTNLITIDQAQVSGNASGITLSPGLNVGLVRNYFGSLGLAAIANFLQSQANTNIMSTPNLVTLDNEEAKIIVGSNVPFVTGQFTSTGTALTNPFQTIERKDVGITLRIKPQIGENGSIRMTIFQESSSVSTVTAPGTSNAGPSTNKRSIESNVVVDDGQILVLGGLIEDSYKDEKSKVPLLGDLPYIGNLFRSETRTKTRTNLMVFLRPTVLRDAESANKLSVDRYDLIRSFQKDQQPTPNLILPVADSPVVPPLRKLEDSTAPIAAPQTSPGTTGPTGKAKPTPPDNPPAVATPVPPTPPASAPAPTN